MPTQHQLEHAAPYVVFLGFLALLVVVAVVEIIRERFAKRRRRRRMTLDQRAAALQQSDGIRAGIDRGWHDANPTDRRRMP